MDNVYDNAVTEATENPLMPDPDETDEAFATAANLALERAVEIARTLVGAHQGAAAIVVEGDWGSVRKYFSLSDKYARWRDYRVPARGLGTHGWLLENPQTVRLTQEELEAHPHWRNFGREGGRHPPMVGWLAVPIRDSTGKVWGLLQLSDKEGGAFTEADERAVERLNDLLCAALEAHWRVRNIRKGLGEDAGIDGPGNGAG